MMGSATVVFIEFCELFENSCFTECVFATTLLDFFQRSSNANNMERKKYTKTYTTYSQIRFKESKAYDGDDDDEAVVLKPRRPLRDQKCTEAAVRKIGVLKIPQQRQ